MLGSEGDGTSKTILLHAGTYHSPVLVFYLGLA